MKRQAYMRVMILLAAALGQGQALAADLGIPRGSYGLDKTHAYISFGYSHLGFSTPQVGFNDFDVQLQLDAADPSKSEFAVTIEAASVDSRVAKFDEHLRGADYFDVATFPQITFVSTSIQMLDEKTATVQGDLTIKGVTKPTNLKLTLNKAGNHPILRKPTLGVSAVGTISRSQWGLSNYAPAVSDEVTLTVSVEMPKLN